MVPAIKLFKYRGIPMLYVLVQVYLTVLSPNFI